MQSATMLYRSPGPESFEGVSCETVIVDEHEVEEHLAAGWSRNWIEADAVAKAAAGAKLQANEAELQKVGEQLKAAPKAGKARG
jgi:hypothetical protein